jgi:hypothetical protein
MGMTSSEVVSLSIRQWLAYALKMRMQRLSRRELPDCLALSTSFLATFGAAEPILQPKRTTARWG